MKRITKSQNSVVEQDLVLVGGTDHVEHDVGLHLVQDNAVVVEDDVARLLGGLVNEALFERLLRLQVGVRVTRCACAAYQTSSPLAIAHATNTRGASCLSSSMLRVRMRTRGSGVRRRKVLGEYPGAILSAEDEDCLNGEKGHSRRHVGGWDVMLR